MSFITLKVINYISFSNFHTRQIFDELFFGVVLSEEKLNL